MVPQAEYEDDLLAALDALFEDKLGPDIEADARRYCPVGPSWGDDEAHPRTPAHEGGELRDSIEHHMEGHDLIVAAHAPYALFVELGTSAHPIDAHGPWSLWSPVSGQYFGSHVNHPGTKPDPFLRRALDQER